MARNSFEDLSQRLIKHYIPQNGKRKKFNSKVLHINLAQITQEQGLIYLKIKKLARGLRIETLTPSIYILHTLFEEYGKGIIWGVYGNILRKKLEELSFNHRDCDATIVTTEAFHRDTITLSDRKNLRFLKKLYQRYFRRNIKEYS